MANFSNGILDFNSNMILKVISLRMYEFMFHKRYEATLENDR